MSAGLDFYEKLFGPARQDPAPGGRSLRRSAVDRDSLPSPLVYLTQRRLLNRRPHGEWAAIRCPAHKDGAETRPSMRVSLIDGHFRCMACRASGGDVIALHRLITGLGFRDAVHDLGGRLP